MNILWAPWRMDYIHQSKRKGCVLCAVGSNRKRDTKNLVLLRSTHAFSLLNLYPYNNGHFMVCPLRHVKALEGLRQEEIAALFEMIKKTKKLTDRALRPDAYNVGLNLGRESGAGILGHLHVHVVPRWRGDTNFMPMLAHTKVIPQSLASLYRTLRTTP